MESLPSLHYSLDYSGDKDLTLTGTQIRERFDAQKTIFKGDSEALIKLPSERYYTFMNGSNMTMLEFDIVITTGSLTMNREGGYGCFEYMNIGSQSEPSYSDTTAYNNLVASMLDLQSSQTYKGNTLALTAGTTCSNFGQVLGVGTHHFSLTLYNTTLGMSLSMFPLFSRETTQLRCGISNVEAWGIWAGGGSATATLENIHLKCDLIELDDKSYNDVYEDCGGVFKILTTGVSHSAHQIPVGSLQNTLTIPSQVNYADKILVTWRKSANMSVAGSYNTGRVQPSLSSIQFKIGSQYFPSTAVTGSTTNSVEFLCETLNAFNMLNNNNHGSSLNAQGNGLSVATSLTAGASLYNYVGGGNGVLSTTSATSGSFMFGINLSALNNDSLSMFNGVSTIGQVTQLITRHSAVLDILTCDVYVFSSKTLSLDMNTDKVWHAED